MKIEKKNISNVFCFEDVEPGYVFKDSKGVVYMKLDWKCGNTPAPRNAVVLETGCPALFCADTAVEILPDAILMY